MYLVDEASEHRRWRLRGQPRGRRSNIVEWISGHQPNPSTKKRILLLADCHLSQDFVRRPSFFKGHHYIQLRGGGWCGFVSWLLIRCM
jgi:hypothetical protein